MQTMRKSKSKKSEINKNIINKTEMEYKCRINGPLWFNVHLTRIGFEKKLKIFLVLYALLFCYCFLFEFFFHICLLQVLIIDNLILFSVFCLCEFSIHLGATFQDSPFFFLNVSFPVFEGFFSLCIVSLSYRLLQIFLYIALPLFLRLLLNFWNVLGLLESAGGCLRVHHAFPVRLANDKADFTHFSLSSLFLNVRPTYLKRISSSSPLEQITSFWQRIHSGMYLRKKDIVSRDHRAGWFWCIWLASCCLI